jgi:DNA-binding transcriptional regulator GbsR (MarR family)
VLVLKLVQSYFGSLKNLFTQTFLKDIQTTATILQDYTKKNNKHDFEIQECKSNINKKSGGNTKKYNKPLKHNKNITKKHR